MTNDKIQMTNKFQNPNDKNYSEKKINEYLKELASKNPVPGGGSASALVGATGAALISKVANFTIGKEKYKAVEEEAKGILERAEDLRKDFLKLCSDDAKAYKKLSEAFRFPKGEARDTKLQGALKEAMGVPLAICEASCEAMGLCAPLVEKGNKNLASDVDCAAGMLKCAYQAALLNVEVNLNSIKDEKFISKTKEALKLMKGKIE